MNKSYDVYMCREDCPENALDRDKIISMLFKASSLDMRLASRISSLNSFPMNIWPLTYISKAKTISLLKDRIELSDIKIELLKLLQEGSEILQYKYK